jgi:hypothetical protein
LAQPQSQNDSVPGAFSSGEAKVRMKKCHWNHWDVPKIWNDTMGFFHQQDMHKIDQAKDAKSDLV